jgi:hypothetical protein
MDSRMAYVMAVSRADDLRREAELHSRLPRHARRVPRIPHVLTFLRPSRG